MGSELPGTTSLRALSAEEHPAFRLGEECPWPPPGGVLQFSATEEDSWRGTRVARGADAPAVVVSAPRRGEALTIRAGEAAPLGLGLEVELEKAEGAETAVGARVGILLGPGDSAATMSHLALAPILRPTTEHLCRISVHLRAGGD